MCGRLSLTAPADRLAERFGVAVADAYRPSYNVAPTDDVAVVRDDAPEALDVVRWGLVPRWADDPSGGHENARAESAAETPSFAGAFEERRCLVVADGFYDWDPSGDPYRFERSDGDPFALAGLWERWTDGERTLTTATVLTVAAGDLLAGVHDRMPVPLDAAEEATWLGPDTDRAADLLRPREGAAFERYPVGRAVNDPTNDGPAVAERAATRQGGLEEF